MRIHVLGLPHTQTTEEFTTCAFTQKALNLCRMMHRRGHEVFHYGVEILDPKMRPECAEHVDVIPYDLWKKLIGKPGSQFYNINTGGALAPYHALFAKNMRDALKARTGKPDTEIVCQTWGGAQRDACNGINQFLVESGIGYPISWADWRVYESYAWMHMHLGRDQLFGGAKWYWSVIPNAFPVQNFTPVEKRGDELLYIGRLNWDKGVGIAIDVAKEVGRKIAIVGQGDPAPFLKGNPHVRYLPPVGVEERRVLMANAHAVMCPTQFIEPFCGVNVEAQLSGTPVITTDWGVFPETVVHGVTGWRCRSFEQFVWAAKNVDKLDGRACREWAEQNYSLERVALLYEEFFQQCLNVRDRRGKVPGPTGFYERHPGRTQLDWGIRHYPRAVTEISFSLDRPHEAPVVAPYDHTEAEGPQVCIAVSCKGQAKYLSDAVQSLIEQTYTRWQAVIACGDDESEAEAKRLAALDPRIVVLPKRATFGLADARNRALHHGAPTPYCAALDADDKYAPTYLETMMALVGPTTIASCNLQEFGDRENGVDLQVSPGEFQARIPHDNMIHCASVFPRALWKTVGGYDPLMFCFEDWEFWIALSKAGASLAHTPSHLFMYRIHSEAMTLRHRPYEEVFKAAIVLRHVDKTSLAARTTVEHMPADLLAKIAQRRREVPVTPRGGIQWAPGNRAARRAAAARTPAREPDVGTLNATASDDQDFVPLQRDEQSDPPAPSPDDPHDAAFFEQMRACRDPYRRLADCMHGVVGAQTAIDIGCGIGLQTLRLKELGWNIVGADHSPAAIEMREPGIEIEPIDLTAAVGDVEPVDCVICTETAEHIEAEHAEAIVDNVARRAKKTIVWSAAVPGQEWHGHVNLQPPSYWLAKFAARGWVVDRERTIELRTSMLRTNAQHWGCNGNFHVLVRAEAATAAAQ